MKKSESRYVAPQETLIPLHSCVPLCVSTANAQAESYEEFETLDGMVH